MFVVAESGSTKCDWAIVEKSGEIVAVFSTMGFNPYFHSKELIIKELHTNRGHFPPLKKVEKVYFYGAGCSSDSLKNILKEALSFVFTGADVQVDHDLVGAAYSAYKGKPGIACILGTGSNSCFFDGQTIHEEVPSLAFILGDEGSGCYFGKKLLQDFFYKRMPIEIQEPFVKEFQLTKDMAVKNIYNNSQANVYLASYMHFISNFKDHPYLNNMIEEGFKEFVKIHIKCFKNYKDVPVNFIGSVAYYQEEILKKVAKKEGFKIGSVSKRPIDGLIEYHLKYKLEIA